MQDRIKPTPLQPLPEGERKQKLAGTVKPADRTTDRGGFTWATIGAAAMAAIMLAGENVELLRQLLAAAGVSAELVGIIVGVVLAVYGAATRPKAERGVK